MINSSAEYLIALFGWFICLNAVIMHRWITNDDDVFTDDKQPFFAFAPSIFLLMNYFPFHAQNEKKNGGGGGLLGGVWGEKSYFLFKIV